MLLHIMIKKHSKFDKDPIYRMRSVHNISVADDKVIKIFIYNCCNDIHTSKW